MTPVCFPVLKFTEVSCSKFRTPFFFWSRACAPERRKSLLVKRVFVIFSRLCCTPISSPLRPCQQAPRKPVCLHFSFRWKKEKTVTTPSTTTVSIFFESKYWKPHSQPSPDLWVCVNSKGKCGFLCFEKPNSRLSPWHIPYLSNNTRQENRFSLERDSETEHQHKDNKQTKLLTYLRKGNFGTSRHIFSIFTSEDTTVGTVHLLGNTLWVETTME